MNVLIALGVVAIGLAVAYVISAPLRRGGRDGGEPKGELPKDPIRKDDLLAAREAKYKEIKDAELDYRTGKLSQEDYENLDAELRAEAIEILKRLDKLESDGEIVD